MRKWKMGEKDEKRILNDLNSKGITMTKISLLPLYGCVVTPTEAKKIK